MDHSAYLPAIEHKTFALKVKRNGFYPGNAFTDAQTSTYVRAYSETECNGFTNKPGHLQDFDLAPHRRHGLPPAVETAVKHHLKTSGGVLYCIRHYDRGQRIVHGWILTDYYGNEVLYRTWPTSQKSESCMAYALKVIELHAIHYNAVRACHLWDDTLARLAESTPGGFVAVIQMMETIN